MKWPVGLIVFGTIIVIAVSIYIGVQMGTGLGKTMASFGIVAGFMLLCVAYEISRARHNDF